MLIVLYILVSNLCDFGILSEASTVFYSYQILHFHAFIWEPLTWRRTWGSPKISGLVHIIQANKKTIANLFFI